MTGIKITVNGEPREMLEKSTAADLVLAMDLRGGRIAMEVNQEILPRSEYETYRLKSGDQIEVVHAVGGGSK